MRASWLVFALASLGTACLEGDPNPLYVDAAAAAPTIATPAPTGTGTTPAPTATGPAVDPGHALVFTTAQDSVVFPGQFLPKGNSAFTVEAWISSETVGTNNVILTWGAPGQGTLLQFGLNAGHCYVSDGISRFEGNARVATGAFQHCAIACEAVGCEVIVAGSVEKVGAMATRAIGSGAQAYLGAASPFGVNAFPFAIDELRIWSEKRSADTIRANMRSTVARTSPTLLAYFQMENATGGSGGTLPQVAKTFFAGDGKLTGTAASPGFGREGVGVPIAP